MADYGKPFENQFRKDFERTFPYGRINRFKDQMSGFKNASQNDCDFYAYNYPREFFIECKAHAGSSINWSAIPQYDRLIDYKDVYGNVSGFVIWFYEKDKVIFVSIQDAIKMHEQGEKSIGLRMLNDTLYNIIEVPSIKKRVFMESDYNFLMEVPLYGQRRN